MQVLLQPILLARLRLPDHARIVERSNEVVRQGPSIIMGIDEGIAEELICIRTVVVVLVPVSRSDY